MREEPPIAIESIDTGLHPDNARAAEAGMMSLKFIRLPYTLERSAESPQLRILCNGRKPGAAQPAFSGLLAMAGGV